MVAGITLKNSGLPSKKGKQTPTSSGKIIQELLLLFLLHLRYALEINFG
jgi:hypothetical protein